ncbi:hypothetical protein [Nocardia sp. AG03]|uniref:hypothetical protein n=1 Tax=Nocardia sp. AG03 TaxID=3025312 RepID=UPI002418A065|nr:hypothetical protein [Nocardia sp. AG03]
MTAPRPGSTSNVSVSLPVDVLTAVRDRAGRRGVSAYITEAVRHQLEMDGLAEIVTDFETTHDPLTEDEIAAAADDMFGDTGEADGRGAP